jgi:hypothetical protein
MGKELFDYAAQKLEALTGLDRLEARGTLRIGLKEAGLDAKQLTLPQLQVLFDKVMPQQLELRAIDDAKSVCSAIIKEVRSADLTNDAPAFASCDEVFDRLAEG